VTLKATDTPQASTIKMPEASLLPVDREVREFIEQIAQELQAPSKQEGAELNVPGLTNVSSDSSGSSATPTTSNGVDATIVSNNVNFDAVEVTSTEIQVSAVDRELERFKHQMQASLLLSSRDDGDDDESEAAARLECNLTGASFTDDAFEEETRSEISNRERLDADDDWVTMLSQAWQTSVMGEDHGEGIEVESLASSQHTGFWNDDAARQPAPPAYASYRVPLNDTWGGSIGSQSSVEDESFFGMFLQGSRTEDDYSLTAASYVSEASSGPRQPELFRKGYIIRLVKKDSKCESEFDDDEEGDQAFVPLPEREAAAAQAVWDSLPAAFGTPLRVPNNDEGGQAFAPLPQKEAAAAQAVWDRLPSAFGVTPREAASDAESSISWTASEISESPSSDSLSFTSVSSGSSYHAKPRRVMANRSMMSYGSTTLGSIAEDREAVLSKLRPWRPFSCLYGD
jgi:hypothetical protein